MIRLLLSLKHKRQQRIQAHKLQEELATKVLAVWMPTIFPRANVSVPKSGQFFGNIGRTAMSCGLTLNDATYATQTQLFTLRNPDHASIALPEWKIEASPDLPQWIALGSDWTLWHHAGLSIAETTYQKQLPVDDPERITFKGLEMLAALQEPTS